MRSREGSHHDLPVRTAIVESEELAAKIIDHDRAALHLDQLALSRRNLIDGRDDVAGHQASP
jgi:hypothetical protein